MIDYILSIFGVKKVISAAALILDQDDRIMVVKSPYKLAWSLPGGIVEKRESPSQGCIREVWEEVGLNLLECRFLGIIYRSGIRDGLNFIFYGGKVNSKTAEIKLQALEISEYRFVSRQEAEQLLNQRLAKRLELIFTALRKQQPFYAEADKSD